MIPDRLAALRSRISAEPAGSWLDAIVAQFALGWKWMSYDFAKDTNGPVSYLIAPDKFDVMMSQTWYFGRAGSEMPGNPGYLPPSSSDHNACFAALAALEKREVPLRASMHREPSVFGIQGWAWHFFLHTFNDDSKWWHAADPNNLPLAAARAIALAAVDNGVEVEP